MIWASRFVPLVPALALAATLAGCAELERTAPPPSGAMAAAPPPPAQAAPDRPALVAQPPATGAAAAQAAASLRDRAYQIRTDIARLEGGIAQRTGGLQLERGELLAAAQRESGAVAAIEARLRGGAAPADPSLQAIADQARGELDRIDTGIRYLEQLVAQNGADAGMAAFLRDATRQAAALPGSEEERRALVSVGDEVNRAAGQIDRLGAELRDEIARQRATLARERPALAALGEGIRAGRMTGRAAAPPPAASAPTTAPAPAAAPGAGPRSRPLVTIRFDRPNPPYEQALYTAVSKALEVRPDTGFELVAVAPPGGGRGATEAQRHAEGVLRSLTGMGVARDRIMMSETVGPQAQSPEVRLYLR